MMVKKLQVEELKRRIATVGTRVGTAVKRRPALVVAVALLIPALAIFALRLGRKHAPAEDGSVAPIAETGSPRIQPIPSGAPEEAAPAAGTARPPQGAATIRVSSVPDGARIYLASGGKLIGTTDADLAMDQYGKQRTIVLRKEGYFDEHRVVRGTDLVVRLRPRLGREPRVASEETAVRRRGSRATRVAIAASRCALTINSEPSARVYIDGRDTRKFTPLVRHRIDCGTHRIILWNSDLAMGKAMNVTLQSGRELRQTVELQPGRMDGTPVPSGKRKVGRSPNASARLEGRTRT